MSDAPRSPVHGFGALVAETLRDAIRRRGLIVAALASVGAALLLQRCGSCDAAVTVQGESVALQDGPLGAVGLIVAFGLVALWTYAVTALLASDGLATALEDGSAESLLARPVSRDVFVGARLVGVWSGAAGMGAALLALLAGIAVTRHELAGAPALLAIGSVATAALGVAALAMLASLSLPRVASLLLLTALGLAVGGIEVAALFGSVDRGVVGAVAAFGPAWLSAPVSALAPWLGHPLPAPPPWPLARGLAWTALSVIGLLVRFRRVELLR